MCLICPSHGLQLLVVLKQDPEDVVYSWGSVVYLWDLLFSLCLGEVCADMF